MDNIISEMGSDRGGSKTTGGFLPIGLRVLQKKNQTATTGT